MKIQSGFGPIKNTLINQTAPHLYPARAQVFFKFIKLRTEQSFTFCHVNLKQNESNTGTAKPSVQAHCSERSKAASVLNILTEPVKCPLRNFHTY